MAGFFLVAGEFFRAKVSEFRNLISGHTTFKQFLCYFDYPCEPSESVHIRSKNTFFAWLLWLGYLEYDPGIISRGMPGTDQNTSLFNFLIG